MKSIAIIPARYDSTRFPGKPLVPINGIPMLKHVYDNVIKSGLFLKVIIATDDERIFSAAESWHAEVVMTAKHHESGTERCAEVVAKLKLDVEVIINVQGDEPFIAKEPLEELLSLFNNNEVEIATLVQKINEEAEIQNPNVVKAVLGINKKALYFSRSAIPFVRNSNKSPIFWKHIGLYGYRLNTLKKITQLTPTPLEQVESLEQLRWLEHGIGIFAEETNYRMLAVDTPEDLKKVEDYIFQTK